MKQYGKIIGFNGYHGNIKGLDGIDYTLLAKDLVDSGAEIADNVEFEPENIKTPELEVNMARFVKVLKKEQNNTYNHR